MHNFNFTCSCGVSALAPKLAENDWAALAGYGDMFALRMYETEELARAKNEFKALEKCPSVGDSLWLGLTFPFAAALGESFWCIHEPPSFFYAGVDNDDTEIRQFSFVRCRMTEMKITDQDVRKDDGFWLTKKAGIARANVEAVMPLDDVLTLPLSDATPDDQLWLNLNFAGTTLIFRQGNLVYVLCQTVADWGFWTILHDTPETTDLLVFSEHGDHEDVVRVGRTRLRQGDKMIGPGVPEGWLKTDVNPCHIRRDASTN
jgi:hypothetical protein